MSKNSLVGLSGLEPPTSRLSGVCSNQLSYKPKLTKRGRLSNQIALIDHKSDHGGDKRTRTVDPLLAKQVLYQLSYTPKKGVYL